MKANDIKPISASFLGRFMGSADWLTIEGRRGGGFLIPTRCNGRYYYMLAMMGSKQEGRVGWSNYIATDSIATLVTGQINDFPTGERVMTVRGGALELENRLPDGKMAVTRAPYGFSGILFNQKDCINRDGQSWAGFPVRAGQCSLSRELAVSGTLYDQAPIRALRRCCSHRIRDYRSPARLQMIGLSQ